jgi:hypothetical protein
MTQLLTGAFPVLVIAGVVLIGVGVVIAAQRAERRRQAEYNAYAADHNFQYVAARDGAQREYETLVPVFDTGYARQWRYEISGRIAGHDFAAFEYRYTVSTGRSSATFRDAMIKWHEPTVALPQFVLGPESFFSRVGQAVFGMQDVDFAEDPVFSRAYVLKGEPSDVIPLFTPDLRTYLVSHPNQHLAGSGPALFWWWRRPLPPAQLDSFLAAGAEVAGMFFKSQRLSPR